MSPRPRLACAAGVLLLAAAAHAGPAPAEEPASPPPATPGTPAPADEPPAPPSNFWLAALEGPVLVNVTLNLFGRLREADTFNVSFDSWRDNLQADWEFDPNSFATNQFAHPYQGSLYMSAARSLGNGFYVSAALTTVGSWVWETAMEIHPPSINDQITTSVAGALFGEALFRLSTISLGAADRPGFWRELGATAVAPMHGVNRFFTGNRYRDRRVQGIPWYGELATSLGLAGSFHDEDTSTEWDATDVTVAARAFHGLPGAEGWRFRRPFDHFDASLSLTLNGDSLGDKAFGSILVRGLLAARPYGEGANAGLWGLFAAYDYIAPQVFRASSSNLAFGTVGQRHLGRGFVLLGTAYAGLGFGAAGVAEEIEDKRDYHFGAQAVGLVDLGLVWAERVRLRGAVRGYLVGDELSPDKDSFEDVQYGVAELVVRIAGPHALAIAYTGGRRKARYPDVPDVEMTVNHLAIGYRLVSDAWLGVGR